jgi:SAM-dependent methyltransferase
MFAGRSRAMHYFKKYLEESDLTLKDSIKIGIVGGSRNEHELKVLDELRIKYELYILNITGETDYFLDLNSKTNILPSFKFDLVLCSQVLEHIWNIENAIKILKDLSKTDGYIYLNVPFSNMVHRDEISDFCTPGYSSSFLRKNFEHAGLSTINSVDFGTRRLYNSIHLLQIWLYAHELQFPLTFGKQRMSKFRIVRKVFNLSLYTKLLVWDNNWIENGQFSTESLIFAKK